MKRSHPFLLLLFLVYALLILPEKPLRAQNENLDVLTRWIEWTNTENALIQHLNQEAFAFLDSRDQQVQSFHTREDWLQRQKKVREIMVKLVGPFPDKTPLRARTTGIIQKKGFRIEKIIYESQPGLHVTANLFLPDRSGSEKAPAIIHVSGHAEESFRFPPYQQQILNLVKKGFIVFAIDPVGQGERVQYWDEENKASRMSGAVGEHSHFGNQMFLSGVSPIRYFIWDGIRGLDYLLTRPEVDSGRIGITGHSGGGTQAVYIAAFDDRIHAAAPENFVTSKRRLIESIGVQDAEQNLYRGLAHGIEHADLLLLRAPKPLLILATTNDFFSIQGTRETSDELQRAYLALGHPENFEMVEDVAGHAVTKRNREALYAFFQYHLNHEGSASDLEVQLYDLELFQVTPGGQLAITVDGKRAFDLNKEYTEELHKALLSSREMLQHHLETLGQRAREISGYRAPEEHRAPEEKPAAVFRGRHLRDGYSIEKYALPGEGDYFIPLLMFIPYFTEHSRTLIYLHPQGKSFDAAVGGKIEQWVKKGYTVAAPDVLGSGELKDRSGAYVYAAQFLSVNIGRSITAIQAGDVSRVVSYLKTRPGPEPEKIGALAFGKMSPVLLHAVAFNASIQSAGLVEPLVSYRSIVMSEYYDEDFSRYFVAGALTAYDLPDLMGLIAPRRLALVQLKDPLNQPASEALVNEELDFPRAVYREKNIEENFILWNKPVDVARMAHWLFAH